MDRVPEQQSVRTNVSERLFNAMHERTAAYTRVETAMNTSTSAPDTVKSDITTPVTAVWNVAVSVNTSRLVELPLLKPWLALRVTLGTVVVVNASV